MKKITINDLQDEQIGKLAVGIIQKHIDRESRAVALLALANALENVDIPTSLIQVSYQDIKQLGVMQLNFSLNVDFNDFTNKVMKRAVDANNSQVGRE